MTFGAFCQSGNIEWKIDTIQKDSEKSYLYYEVYKDSILLETANAYFYPISYSAPKFCPLTICILGKFFKNEVQADNIVFHGTTKNWKDGKYRIGKYENGEKKEMTYFDSGGNEITYKDFYGNIRSEGDPEHGTNQYIIHGTEKR